MNPSVEAMLKADNPMTPTAPLADFVEDYEKDDNLWWRIADGHRLNLFDAAVERLQELGELNGSHDQGED